MTAVGSTLAEIARLSGSDEAEIAEHLEEAGLLRPDGAGTRLAHLVGAARTSSDGVLSWRLDLLETAIREGLDQPPPKGPDQACATEHATALSSDERVLLSSGWTFDARRDAFEADLLRRVGAALELTDAPSSAVWRNGALLLVDGDGRSRTVHADLKDDLLRFDSSRIRPIGTGSPATNDDHQVASPPAAAAPTPIEATAAMRAPTTVGACLSHDPRDRQSAWSEAMARFRNSGATATATAYAAGLRMNDSTREALLRGGIPTDHVLFAVCAAMDVEIDVERSAKGTSGDPDHYPRLSEAIARRSMMVAVSSGTMPQESRAERSDRSTSAASCPPPCRADVPTSSDAGDALLRVLSAARSDDMAIAGFRRRSKEVRRDAENHRRRAEEAERSAAVLDDAITDIRMVVGPAVRGRRSP